jgi:hypothetical protein
MQATDQLHSPGCSQCLAYQRSVGRLTMMVSVYGATPPLKLTSIAPHCVKAEVSTLKSNPSEGGSNASTSEDNKSIANGV